MKNLLLVLLISVSLNAFSQAVVYSCIDAKTGEKFYTNKNLQIENKENSCKLVKSLELGMTQNEAREIVGYPVKSSQTRTRTQIFTIHEWTMKDGAILTFHGDKLESIKTQDR